MNMIHVFKIKVSVHFYTPYNFELDHFKEIEALCYLTKGSPNILQKFPERKPLPLQHRKWIPWLQDHMDDW